MNGMKHSHIPAMLALAVMLCVSLLIPAGAGAASVFTAPDLSGMAQYQFHYGFDAKAITSDSLKLRLALDGDFAAIVGYHLDFGADFSTKPEPSSAFKLGEAYLDAALGPVDLRAGNLLVNWGAADAINPTNVVNPVDMLAITDLGLAASPVPAVAATYYIDDKSAISGVLVLDFVAARIPGALASVEPDGMPDAFHDRLEVALRGETMVGGYNVYASYFRGWEDLPAAWMQATGLPAPQPPMIPHLKYRRMQQFGLAAAGTLGNAAVWFEGAVNVPDKVAELDTASPTIIPMSSNDPWFQFVAGADYTFNLGRGLFTSAQLIYDSAGALMSPYVQPGAAREAGVYSMLVARYSPADDHQLELVGLLDLKNGAGLVIPRYTYKMTQAVELWAGVVTAFGDSGPMGAAASAARGVVAGVKACF